MNAVNPFGVARLAGNVSSMLRLARATILRRLRVIPDAPENGKADVFELLPVFRS